MLGRERREERHDAPAAGAVPGGGEHRYQMREKLASIGDDFCIENGAGQRVYKVDGRALRIRETFKIKDMQGNAVAEIQEKLVAIRDTMDIARAGQTIATVKKALVTPLRGRFAVNVAGGADMDVQGNILDQTVTPVYAGVLFKLLVVILAYAPPYWAGMRGMTTSLIRLNTN